MKNFQQSALYHMATNPAFLSTAADALAANFSKADPSEAYQKARADFFALSMEERKALGRAFEFNQDAAIRSLIK